MDAPEGVFKGTIDRFNGVLIESASEHDETTDFAEKLQSELAKKIRFVRSCWEKGFKFFLL